MANNRQPAGGVMEAVRDSDVPLALMCSGAIVFCNGAFEEAFGDCAGRRYEDFFVADGLEQLNWLMRGDDGECDKVVLRLREALGGGDVMVQIWPLDAIYCLFSLRRDYKADRLADIDGLTQLPNRRKAMMLLDIERARARRMPELSRFCLTLGDIDHFKNVNDTHGHEAGDRVLRHVSRLLTSLLREGDWAARWGGEEFMIFTPERDVVTGIQPIERIRRAMEETPCPGNPPIRVTMSFGLTSAAAELPIRDSIAKSDMLLYEAKRNGRNRIEWECEGDSAWIAENIRKALAAGRLALAPIPVRDWEGRVAARVMAPCLRGMSFEEVGRMLAAVARLRLQALVDAALLKELTAGGGEEALQCFFPLREALIEQCEEKVLRGLSEVPSLCVCVDAEAPLSPAALRKIRRDGRPVALLNYAPEQSPASLLTLEGLRYVVFADDAGAAGVVAMLGDKVRCFAQCVGDADEARLAAWRRMGFAGWTRLPASEEVPLGEEGGDGGAG